MNRHERFVVGDLFKFNKARWIVGRCSLFVCVCAAHHRLFGDVHQVLDVVVLVLLKGREAHVQHHLSLGPHHLPLGLLLLIVLQLRTKRSVTTTDTKTYKNDTCISNGNEIILV